MPNQRDPDKVPIMVYVPRELKEAAKARAEERGETVTDVIVRALKRYVRPTPRPPTRSRAKETP